MAIQVDKEDIKEVERRFSEAFCQRVEMKMEKKEGREGDCQEDQKGLDAASSRGITDV